MSAVIGATGDRVMGTEARNGRAVARQCLPQSNSRLAPRGRNAGGRRLRLVGAAAIFALPLSGLHAQPAHAAATSQCFAHPANTVSGGTPSDDGYNEADVVEVCIDYSAAEGLRLSVAVTSPSDPLADVSWSGTSDATVRSALRWTLDTDGDGMPDRRVSFRAVDGELRVVARELDAASNSTDASRCLGTGSFDGSRYHAVVGSTCLGNAAKVRVSVSMNYYAAATEQMFQDRVLYAVMGEVSRREDPSGEEAEQPEPNPERRLVAEFKTQRRHTPLRTSVLSGRVFRLVPTPTSGRAFVANISSQTTVTVIRARDGYQAQATVTRSARGTASATSRAEARSTATREAISRALGEALPVARARAAARLGAKLAPYTTAEGFRAVRGRGPIVGSGGGLRTYSVQVQPGLGWDIRTLTRIVEEKLSHPRGWTRHGGVRLRRVEPADASIHIVLAAPSTVDRYCARIGLNTAGYFSCWTGRSAMINVNRWNHGASGFNAGIATYRTYVVNHEVGHALGHDHRSCSASGRLAPVMMQQSKGTYPCRPNGLPYP